MNFPSREGLRLWADQRSLVKIVYSHPNELELFDLQNRVECPIQPDPTKHQRDTCRVVTNRNIRDAIVKVFEFTTFDNPDIITIQMFPPTCKNQRATFFINVEKGNSVYFRLGGKQDSKLWSCHNFDKLEISELLNRPDVNILTPQSKD